MLECLALHPLTHVTFGVLLRSGASLLDHGDELALVLDGGCIEVGEEGPARPRVGQIAPLAGDRVWRCQHQ